MQDFLKNIPPSSESCPVRRSLGLLGGKWTLLILFQINERVMRFGELKRAIPGISEKMLIQELGNLVQHGLVSRKSYPEVPPKVEYTLTDVGVHTLPIIETLTQFGLKHLNNGN